MGRAVIAAAAEAGVRITLLDACYLHGGIERFRDARRRRLGRARRALRGRPTARVGAAIHSVRAVDPDRRAIVAEWAAARPLHAHVSEQPAENEECLAAHGRTPTALLADAGALSERFTAVHATHLTDDDVALLGGAGVDGLPVPDDRARPRRRHRPGAAAARRGRARSRPAATPTR